MRSISNRIGKVGEHKTFVTKVEELYIRALKATDATGNEENNSESDSSKIKDNNFIAKLQHKIRFLAVKA